MADSISNDWGSRSHVRTLVLMVATAFGIYLCYRLAVPFLPPLAWALGLAVLFTPFQRWVESKLNHPRLAAFVSVLVVGVIVVVPLTFVGQRLVVQAAKGADLIETKVTSGEWRRTFSAQPLLASLADKIDRQIDLPGTFKSFATWLSTYAGSIVTGSLLQAVDFCLTFYLLFFFLRDRRAALQTLKSLSPLTQVEMDRIFSRVSDAIHATVYGTLAVSAVQGLLGGLMFWWLGLPAPLLWGVVMALLALVPVLGAFVVWIPAALFLMLEGCFGKALILTLWGLIVVGTIDNLMRPILVGRRLKLHTILGFISVVGGLIQFGPAGLILGPAVLAVTTVLLEIWSGRNSAGLAFEPGVLSGFERQGGLEDPRPARPRLNKPSE
ncbi:MAG: hypothetical protein B7Z47_03855 [Chthoniobacter sp. 12-60-6]|nr:MAG: hypothetical protein B7Z47_03855 [Chthoniobacter sp. 12-60-6]